MIKGGAEWILLLWNDTILYLKEKKRKKNIFEVHIKTITLGNKPGGGSG